LLGVAKIPTPGSTTTTTTTTTTNTTSSGKPLPRKQRSRLKDVMHFDRGEYVKPIDFRIFVIVATRQWWRE
jgi:hypothetical protein